MRESREEDDKLDGVDVVGDDHKGSLLGFDEGNTIVEPILGEDGLLGLLGGSSVSFVYDEFQVGLGDKYENEM